MFVHAFARLVTTALFAAILRLALFFGTCACCFQPCRSMFCTWSSSNQTKCKECGVVINDSERLKKHKQIAHNKKKEKCRTCGAEFSFEEGLRKHKKKCK